jgi:hypothetical protein
MSLCTVAELKAALGVGSLYSDAIIQEVCDAADNVLLPFLWSNQMPTVAHSNVGTKGTLYFNDPVKDFFYVGQTITISNSGVKYNGSKVVQALGEYSIDVTTDHTTDSPRHPIIPYGTAAGTAYTDFTTIPAIQEAALMVAESIWQARQANSGNGMAPDGSMGSFYAMSSQLISRIRGLIAPYLDPRSMVG